LINEALAESIDAWSLAICSGLSDVVDEPSGDDDPLPEELVPEPALGVEPDVGVELPEELVEPVPVLAWPVVEPAVDEPDVVPGVEPLAVDPVPGELEPPDGLEPAAVEALDAFNSLASVASAWETTF
jgi:hypothetical protein